MCGRYTLFDTEKIKRHYNLATMPKGITENFNVAPGQFMPVVLMNETNKPEVEVMKWGLVPVWAKDPVIGYKLINARADSVFNKPMWRTLVLKQRVLIPANGFYEWKKPSEAKDRKQPYYIHPFGQHLFSFAGVWSSWRDVEGKEWRTYSIITTEPNKEMSNVHNRMPVILNTNEEKAWLDPKRQTREQLESILCPYHDGGLEVYSVSDEVNSARNNNERLIQALS